MKSLAPNFLDARATYISKSEMERDDAFHTAMHSSSRSKIGITKGFQEMNDRHANEAARCWNLGVMRSFVGFQSE